MTLCALITLSAQTTSIPNSETDRPERSAVKHSMEEDYTEGLLSKVMARIEAKSRYIPTINGAIQVGYLFEAPPVTVEGEKQFSNSFTFNTARLNIKGNPLDWLQYNLQVEFANKVRVLDFNVNFHPLAHLPVKSQYINFWIGQGKVPITMESQLGPAVFEAINYSPVISALCGYKQDLTPELTNMAGGRDMGVAVYGYALKVEWGGKPHDFFEYKLGVYNGTGMNCLDKDIMKDVSGWVYLHPTPALTVGGSFYVGAYKGKLTMNGTDTMLTTRRDRWAASFRYDDKAHWLARAEYVGGRTHGQFSDGWYAMLQYTINPNRRTLNQWAVVAKYDAYRYNCKRLPDYCNHRALAGINYRPVPWLYIQAIYIAQFNCDRHQLRGINHSAQLAACLIY